MKHTGRVSAGTRQAVKVPLSIHVLPRITVRTAAEDSPATQPPTTHHDSSKASFLQRNCSVCQGSSQVECVSCGGQGRLARGGYQRRQSLPKELVNSKWTAMQETLGWRHFRVKELRKNKAKGVSFVLMQASCDPQAQLWINRDNLRERQLWAAGWIEMKLVRDPDALKMGKGALCRVCKGKGKIACERCAHSSGSALIQL